MHAEYYNNVIYPLQYKTIQALFDASSKAAGIAPLYVAKVLGEYDYSLLDTEIKWVRPVDSGEIKRYLQDISMRIVKGAL